MTREEAPMMPVTMREKAILAMLEAYWDRFDKDGAEALMAAAFDALGAAGFKVIGPVTDEMDDAGKTVLACLFHVMAEAGDLTRKPE